MRSKFDHSTFTNPHSRSGSSNATFGSSDAIFGSSKTTFGSSDATTVQLNGYSEISLADLDSAFSGMGESLTALLETVDLESATIRTLSNTTISGSEDGYKFVYKGSGFTDFSNGDSTEITITSIQVISSEERLQFTGNITYDYESDQYSGYYTSYAYTSRDTSTDTYESFTFKGNLTVDTETGDSAGGTLTSLSMVNTSGYKYALVGSFTVDSAFEVTDGTITSLYIQDADGNIFRVSGASLDAAEIAAYLDSSTYSDLTALYTYVTENLSGNLNMITGAEDDALVGGSGKDYLSSGDGDDSLDGGDGVDRLFGGSGDDTYTVDLVQTSSSSANYKVSMQDAVTESTNAGTDTIVLRGSFTLSKVSTLTLTKNVENLDASATGTTLLKLVGNKLDNTLTGNDGQNQLDGGVGDDVLIGGLEADTLTGGKGSDTFSYSQISDSTSSATDIITDFTSGTDVIDLSALDTGGEVLTFADTTATAYSVWYAQSSGNTIVYVDTTGDAVSDMQIQLTGTISLQSSDFVLS